MGQQHVLHCDFCGGFRHTPMHYRKRLGLCFTCGLLGLEVRDCPSATTAPPLRLTRPPIPRSHCDSLCQHLLGSNDLFRPNPCSKNSRLNPFSSFSFGPSSRVGLIYHNSNSVRRQRDVCLPLLPYALTVTTHVGKQVLCHSFYPDCRLKIGDFILPANLILLTYE